MPILNCYTVLIVDTLSVIMPNVVMLNVVVLSLVRGG